MRLSVSAVLPAVLAAAAASAHAAPNAPSQYAYSVENGVAAPLMQWISSALSQVVPSSSAVEQATKNVYDGIAPFVKDSAYSALDKPDYSDYTIWQVIQENKYLTDLKRVLKYSGPHAKELLDDKSKKLTFLAPINWRHKHHEKGEGGHEDTVMPRWSAIEHQINMFEDEENGAMVFEDDEDREHKRKALAYLIDATLKYHVIDSEKPLNAWQVAQKSSVPTALHIGNGKARRVLGNLLDGEAFRLRVGKSLLPKPSAYFNFYSRLVYPDVNVGGSIVHAVSFPLLIPPSSLQTLYFAQPYFGSLTTALQKIWVAKYLAYPINGTAMHEHKYMSFLHDSSKSKEPVDGLAHMVRAEAALAAGHDEHDDDDGKHKHWKGNEKGLIGVTYFAPANLAWARLPPVLRLYLFSPFGKKLLFKILALHSLPWTIFYADFVHEHHTLSVPSAEASERGIVAKEEQTNVDAKSLVSSGNWPFKVTDGEAVPLGKANVTKYTFTTGCPKLKYRKPKDDITDPMHKSEFEEIDVEVFRYYVLPGERGPLQTRVAVQGVPVLIQDIPTGNGAIHQIERFIMPKGHPHKGIWQQAAEEARLYGFGDVDVAALDL